MIIKITETQAQEMLGLRMTVDRLSKMVMDPDLEEKVIDEWKKAGYIIKSDKDQNRYTSHEIALITILIRRKVNLKLWNGDTIRVDKESNLLTDIEDKSGKELLRIFNNIEYNRIVEKLRELKE